jgi:ribosomal protein S18 acetylase RimI-like enzyme
VSFSVLSPTFPPYVKRYRMEVGLENVPLPLLPPGFAWQPWDEDLLEAHADVLARSFHRQLDSFLFPSLASREGCYFLMKAVSRRRDFLPEATWLIRGPAGPCASIQAVADPAGVGAIQNVGVTPDARGLGLGRALVVQALRGCVRARLRHARLEVSADNAPALALYTALGFRRRKILYKAVPERPPEGSGVWL